jgi:two-component system sensor kinase FixL
MTGLLLIVRFVSVAHPVKSMISTSALCQRTAYIGHWLRMRGRVSTNEGHPVEVRGILIDIARRKAAEGANSRLAAIVAFSDDAIVGKTLDGIVTDWNRGAEIIFGYGAEEIVSRPISIILPPGLEAETR